MGDCVYLIVSDMHWLVWLGFDDIAGQCASH